MGNSATDPGVPGHTPAHMTRQVALALYYAAIVVALLVLYGGGNFSAPPFVYQGF